VTMPGSPAAYTAGTGRVKVTKPAGDPGVHWSTAGRYAWRIAPPRCAAMAGTA